MPDTTPTDSRRRPTWVAAAVGVALVAVGGLWWANQSDDVAQRALPLAATTPSVTPPAVRAPWRPGAPRRVVIPALHVDAPVIPVKAPHRTLIPPSDPTELGWWADGAEPGSAHGSALVAGHTVHTGGGALDHLGRLHAGALVTVRTDSGRLTYRVASVRAYRKGTLARHATELFEQDGSPRLVLLTCTGWNGQAYLSNTVVIATPT